VTPFLTGGNIQCPLAEDSEKLRNAAALFRTFSEIADPVLCWIAGLMAAISRRAMFILGGYVAHQFMSVVYH
jgi:NaMN:DMB phosphoribosyltransferase